MGEAEGYKLLYGERWLYGCMLSAGSLGHLSDLVRSILRHALTLTTCIGDHEGRGLLAVAEEPAGYTAVHPTRSTVLREATVVVRAEEWRYGWQRV